MMRVIASFEPKRKIPSLAEISFLTLALHASKNDHHILQHGHPFFDKESIIYERLNNLSRALFSMFDLIEERCFKYEGYIYGGYIRDYIVRRILPNDIDMRFYNEETIQTFILDLLQFFDVFPQERKIGKYGSVFPTITVLVVHKEFPQLSISIDMTPKSEKEDWDFDCNTLKMKKKGKITYPEWCTTLRDQMHLIQNIGDMEMIPLFKNEPCSFHTSIYSCTDRRSPAAGYDMVSVTKYGRTAKSICICYFRRATVRELEYAETVA